MNLFERPEKKTGLEASLEYGDGDFRIMRHGNFVRCGVTGVVIPLDQLRYWSVARQEAYASPEASLSRVRQSPA